MPSYTLPSEFLTLARDLLARPGAKSRLFDAQGNLDRRALLAECRQANLSAVKAFNAQRVSVTRLESGKGKIRPRQPSLVGRHSGARPVHCGFKHEGV